MRTQQFYEMAFSSEENLCREIVRWLACDDNKDVKHDETFRSKVVTDFRLGGVDDRDGLSISLQASYSSPLLSPSPLSPIIQIWPRSFITKEGNAIILIGGAFIPFDIEEIYQFVEHCKSKYGYDGLGNESNWGIALGQKKRDTLYATRELSMYFNNIIFSISKFATDISSYFREMGYDCLSAYR